MNQAKRTFEIIPFLEESSRNLALPQGVLIKVKIIGIGAFMSYSLFTSSLNSPSSRILIPSSLAFLNLLPAFSPATR